MAYDPQSFEGDLALLDRFQAFGSEVVRLSLLAVASVPFFVVMAGRDAIPAKIFSVAQTTLATSFVFFGIAIAAALAHRYLSSDAMACHLQRLRAVARADRAEEERRKQQTRIRLAWSGPLLAAAAGALAFGSVALAFAFFQIVS